MIRLPAKVMDYVAWFVYGGLAVRSLFSVDPVLMIDRDHDTMGMALHYGRYSYILTFFAALTFGEKEAIPALFKPRPNIPVIESIPRAE